MKAKTYPKMNKHVSSIETRPEVGVTRNAEAVDMWRQVQVCVSESDDALRGIVDGWTDKDV